MYIKKNEKIVDGLNQCWMYELSINSTASAKKLVELKQRRVIGELDLKILSFLFKFDVASTEYVAKYLGYEDVTPIKQRLDKLSSLHVIDNFMLTDGAEVKIKPDAELFYTLDTGALILLQLYTDLETDNYRLEKLMMTSTKVQKRLSAIDFYLKLRETIGSRLISYEVDPMLTCGNTRYVPRAYFTMNTDKGKRGYFLEVIRFQDFYEVDSTRFAEKLARFDAIVGTNAWKKYFDGETAPTLLILTEDNETALRCADLTETSGLSKDCRFCTNESLEKNLSNAFMKYTDGQLKAVRSKNFAKTVQEN